jgi:NAD(P)-dependent dehydrogenase (short-subunit alcohol dehydrogenase family)
MSDRVVLITGAKGGLGSFVTQRFLATGATVVGASRSVAAEDFSAPNFVALPVDFTKAAAVNGAIGSIVDRYGRLDVLVHVLGGFAGGMSVAETDDATWEQMRDLNLTSTFYVLRATIPHLRKSGPGRIVAIGSLAAVEPHPGARGLRNIQVRAGESGTHRGAGEQGRGTHGERGSPRHHGYAGESQSDARRGLFEVVETRGCR